jgi:hypothetical protein
MQIQDLLKSMGLGPCSLMDEDIERQWKSSNKDAYLEKIFNP